MMKYKKNVLKVACKCLRLGNSFINLGSPHLKGHVSDKI